MDSQPDVQVCHGGKLRRRCQTIEWEATQTFGIHVWVDPRNEITHLDDTSLHMWEWACSYDPKDRESPTCMLTLNSTNSVNITE